MLKLIPLLYSMGVKFKIANMDCEILVMDTDTITIKHYAVLTRIAINQITDLHINVQNNTCNIILGGTKQ